MLKGLFTCLVLLLSIPGMSAAAEIELNDVYKKTFDELMGNDQEFTEEKYNLIDKIIIEMSGIIGGIIMRIRKNTGIDD